MFRGKIRVSTQLEQSEPRTPGLTTLLLVAAIIWGVAFAGVELSREFAGGLPTIWPTDGVMVAILFGVQPRAWPVYILAGYAGNVGAIAACGYPVDLAFELPLASFTGTIFIAALLRHDLATVSDLSKLPVLLRFTFLAAGVAPFLATGLNMLVLYFKHVALGLEFFVSVFLSHSLGLMTVTPVALAVRGQNPIKLITAAKVWQAFLVAVLLLCITTGVFLQSRYPLFFMIYPPLVLVVCLFRLPGGALALIAVTLISLAFTRAGHGPAALINTRVPLDRIILVQLFVGDAAVLVLGLAAVLGALDRAREQLSAATEALAQLAVTDSLTGLANRRRLDEVLDQECRRAARNQTCLALLMIDADNFKAYNDHYGHPAGDDCLRAISSTIAQFSTRAGDLTARYGGEELVVLLSETGHLAAVAKAEEIRLGVLAMALPHAGNADHGGVVTVSIGISSFDPRISIADPGTILSLGDKMLYEAKRTGKNKSASNTIFAAQATSLLNATEN